MRARLVMLALAASALVACGSGPRDLSGDRDLIPHSEDFQILNLRLDGRDCKVAYAYIEYGPTSDAATGGPFVVPLGCEGAK